MKIVHPLELLSILKLFNTFGTWFTYETEFDKQDITIYGLTLLFLQVSELFFLFRKTVMYFYICKKNMENDMQALFDFFKRY